MWIESEKKGEFQRTNWGVGEWGMGNGGQSRVESNEKCLFVLWWLTLYSEVL